MAGAMSETSFNLAAWELGVVEGAASLGFAVFTLTDVRIGPHPREQGYDAHIASTTGSSVVWGDEWRFDPADGHLLSLIWNVPNTNTEAPDVLGPTRPATLRLRSVSGEVDMAVTRAFTPERLTCGSAEPLLRPVGYQIAPNLTVLVQDGRWWGWTLDRPLDHLLCGPAPAELGPLVVKWFQLVSDETLDALDDQDPALSAEIMLLRRRAVALKSSAADVLVMRIDAVWQYFYG
jgi:hypothetical protein